MRTNNDILCPLSSDLVNESVTRTISFLVIGLALLSLYTGSFWVAVFLLIDFSIRAFTKTTSLLKRIAAGIANFLAIKPSWANAAPKKFAAALGFLVAGSIALFQLLGLVLAAEITGAVLIFCAVLETAFGVCLGCYVYTYLVIPFLRKK
jgi:hypothetical protein